MCLSRVHLIAHSRTHLPEEKVRDFACVNENRPGVTMEILTPASVSKRRDFRSPQACKAGVP
ncbi:Nitrogenase FeMo-cofactor synthesis FeS core scaffold and assembly protein NifB [Methanosarcina mazei Tuc01]|uniref:Nitrogenase FeMo-cofactor synthesis FeS core scaffold and assembly protein NifB n=1 Tax=Methanosarcina mazei Tuc01 TaxID=1236903 RepID=M1Q7N3_METMZ|nr:Nitrogenase FeMo-cofactor synthesis FeS core scaffold and assembly protein NifB [Methanosarcina mazei Tuc01]